MYPSERCKITGEEMYIQGMSSSLPEDVQIAMYRTIPGLEHCEITRYAYAIEYDCIDATQLRLSLEFKDYHGLWYRSASRASAGGKFPPAYV